MKLHFALALACFTSVAGAFDLLPKAIAKMTTEQQLRFVKSYIDEGFPRGYLTIDGQLIDRGSAAGLLMRAKGEILIPLVAERLESELALKNPSTNVIYNTTSLIVTAGTEEAFLTILRVLKDDPKRRDSYSVGVLVEAFSMDKIKGIALWYKSLDSPDARIRERAGEACRVVFGGGVLSKEIWNAWIDALILRHGHYPSDVEMRNDPIVVAIEGRSMTTAYEFRRKIVEFATKLRQERENAAKK